MDSPAPGEWTAADLPEPRRLSKGAYHDPERATISWSRLKLFMRGSGDAPPDAVDDGAAEYRGF